MNNASIWIKNLFEKIKNNKLFQYLIIGILAVTLIFLACTKSKSNESQNYSQVDEVSAYLENLEEKLSKTLSSVSGAGKVSVVITVESGMQTVLASKTVTTSDENGTKIEESPIIVNGKTVVIKELYPKITGVLIVAQGANNISVLNKLQQATVSLLDIELNQIEILTMK